MDAVGVQRRLFCDPVTLTHLAEQPFPSRTIDTGQTHDGSRYAAGQRQLFRLQHHRTAVVLRLGHRCLVDPFTALLGIDAAAGNEQQALRHLSTLSQPAQDMLQAIDIGGSITGLVMLTGRCAVDQIVRRR
ncbi:hypothetical protein D9M71_396970 [compost metagenome]